MKKIFSLFAVVMMAATMFAGRTFSEGDKLYMDCGAVGWWCNDGVTQTMYFVDAASAATPVVGTVYGEEGSKIYEFACPAGTFESIYEQRGEWNKTGNISLTDTEEFDFIKNFSENSAEVEWGNIGDDPDPEVTYYLYVTDYDTEWENLYVYAWGTKEVFGAWPGMNVREAEVVDGKHKLAMTAKEGAELHLIFNNGVGGEGGQFDSDVIKLTEDHYVTVGDAPEGFHSAAVATKAVKTVENGQIVILRDGIRYNAVGAQL